MSAARRLGRVAVALALVAGTLAAVAATSAPAPAAAQGATSVPPGLRWLAAGDSYSSGEGEANVAPDGPDACQRADGVRGEKPPSAAWAPEAHNNLYRSFGTEDPGFVFRACTGATSANLFSSEDHDGHLRLAQWAPADGRFDLVTFSFGGNDIGFADQISNCVKGGGIPTVGSLADPNPISRRIGDWFGRKADTCFIDEAATRAAIATLGNTLRSRFTQLADNAVTRGGQVVVVGYPNLFSAPDTWDGSKVHGGRCETVAPGDVWTLRGLAGDLNATIAQAANAVNGRNGVEFRFVDLHEGAYEANGAHHSLCGRDQTWLNGVSTGLLSGDRPRKERSFHPNDLGHSGAADLVTKAIRAHDWSKLSAPAALAAAPTCSSGDLEAVLGRLWNDQMTDPSMRPLLADGGFGAPDVHVRVFGYDPATGAIAFDVTALGAHDGDYLGQAVVADASGPVETTDYHDGHDSTPSPLFDAYESRGEGISFDLHFNSRGEAIANSACDPSVSLAAQISCPNVAFSPNSDDGAFSILVDGATCEYVTALVKAINADHNPFQDPSSFRHGDFDCTVSVDRAAAMPSARYRCSNGTVTASWTT